MRNFAVILFLSFILITPVSANENYNFLGLPTKDTIAIKSLLRSQVRYANKKDFNKYISTYTPNYTNADGLNTDSYSSLVKDIWNEYDKISYDIKIKNIAVNNDTATVEVEEVSKAKIQESDEMSGIVTSNADSIYYLQKSNGKWKVNSDKVIRETTSMLYGEAKDLDIKLTAPEEIDANTEYCASLEFTPPNGTVAIASIAANTVEYPQKKIKEVFRVFPEENILERLFISNANNLNEYVVASICLTKADVCNLNVNLKFLGMGYKITRVNVHNKSKENDVENK